MKAVAIAFFLLALVSIVLLALSPLPQPRRLSRSGRGFGDDTHDDFINGLSSNAGGDDTHHGHHGIHGDHAGGHDGGAGAVGDSGGHGGH